MIEELKKIHFKRGDIVIVNRRSIDEIMSAGIRTSFSVPVVVVDDINDIKIINIVNILKIYIKNLFNKWNN